MSHLECTASQCRIGVSTLLWLPVTRWSVNVLPPSVLELNQILSGPEAKVSCHEMYRVLLRMTGYGGSKPIVRFKSITGVLNVAPPSVEVAMYGRVGWILELGYERRKMTVTLRSLLGSIATCGSKSTSAGFVEEAGGAASTATVCQLVPPSLERASSELRLPPALGSCAAYARYSVPVDVCAIVERKLSGCEVPGPQSVYGDSEGAVPLRQL